MTAPDRKYSPLQGLVIALAVSAVFWAAVIGGIVILMGGVR